METGSGFREFHEEWVLLMRRLARSWRQIQEEIFCIELELCLGVASPRGRRSFHS